MTRLDVDQGRMRTRVGLRMFPPSIREALLSDGSFTRERGLIVDCMVSFTIPCVYFQRAELLSKIRALFGNPLASFEICDSSGSAYILSGTNDRGVWSLQLRAGELSIALPDYAVISPETSDRVASLRRYCEETHFEPETRRRWERALQCGPLTDNELEEFENALDATPARAIARIMNHVGREQFSIADLIPRNPEYYMNLIGAPAGTARLDDWTSNCAATHMRDLIAWKPVDGLLLALAMCGGGEITRSLPVDLIDAPTLLQALNVLGDAGDRLSQVGLAEYCLTKVDLCPDLVPPLAAMLAQIRNDDPTSEAGRLHLLSSVFALVYGEISLSGIFRDSPVYWRRLAALAHAALLERCLVAIKFDIPSFCEWAKQARGESFYLQGLIDLRSDPFWIPDYANPTQLKSSFVGRLARAAMSSEPAMRIPELHELLFGEAPIGLAGQANDALMLLPGPIDGGAECRPPLPAEIATLVMDQLSTPGAHSNPFAAFVNSAMLFRVEFALANKAASILSGRGNHVHLGTSESYQATTLLGLALSAATTRSPDLAGAVMGAAWRIYQPRGGELNSDVAFRLGIVAAAAHSASPKWAEAVGECFKRIAFSDLGHSDAMAMLSRLRCLCQLAPELWTSCGAHEAALRALVNSPSGHADV